MNICAHALVNCAFQCDSLDVASVDVSVILSANKAVYKHNSQQSGDEHVGVLSG